jgi:hypothetical protein
MSEWKYKYTLPSCMPFFLAWRGTTITVHTFILNPSPFVYDTSFWGNFLLYILFVVVVVVVVVNINHADRLSRGMVTSARKGEYKNRMFLSEIEHLKQYSRDKHSNHGLGTGYAVNFFVYFLFRQQNSLTVCLRRNRPRHFFKSVWPFIVTYSL